jgi:hypothetical protein
MPRHLLAAATLILALATAATAVSPATPPAPPAPTTPPSLPTTTPASQPDPARWAALLQNLGSSDFAQRDAAQKQLDQTTWRDLDLLKKSITSTADPEVKSRLEARLAVINEEIAANPPPISVNFQNASLTEVADTFSKLLGISLDVWPPSNSFRETFTLTATDQPFWKVFLDLSNQHGLSFQDSGRQLRLTGQGDSWRRAVIVGPIAVFPQSITRQRSANLQNNPGAELGSESMQLSCNVAVDPRLHIISYANPTFTEITDDVGNTLLRQAAPTQTNISSDFNRTLQSAYAPLPIPEKKGTRIASAKGLARFIVQTAEDHIDIDHPQDKNGQSFPFANTTFKLDRFTVQQNANNAAISFSLSAQSPSPIRLGGIVGDRQDDPKSYLTISFVDANGKTAFTTTLRGSSGGSCSGNYTAPFTIRISIPTKTKDLSIPFELKDLPLP